MAPASATTAAQNPAARMATCSRRPIDPFLKSVMGYGSVSGSVVDNLPGTVDVSGGVQSARHPMFPRLLVGLARRWPCDQTRTPPSEPVGPSVPDGHAACGARIRFSARRTLDRLSGIGPGGFTFGWQLV